MALKKLPKGLWIVMLTPFNQNGSIDYDLLRQLTEFYIDSGSAGLFVNCLSSEMYHLSPEERLSLTRSVVEIADGQIPVVSTGTFGGDIDTQAEYMKKVWSTGVSAVIVITSNITRRAESDDTLLSRLQSLAQKVEDIPLGIYECPNPYKRLVSPKIMKWISKSNRFLYHKDTSCDLNNISAKLNVIDELTNLRFYNANTTTALDSLRLGVDGLSPISANFYPELYIYLLRNFDNKKKLGEVKYLQQMLTLMDAVTHNNTYPLAAKIFLNKRGLPIETKVRIDPQILNYEEMEFLENLFEVFKRVSNELKIDLTL